MFCPAAKAVGRATLVLPHGWLGFKNACPFLFGVRME